MKIQSALLASVAVSMLTGGAYAQTTSTEPANSAVKNDTSGIEVVTVTARRRAENLQKVPIAITAFSQDALEKNRIQSATDLQYLVPSFDVSGQFNRNQEFFTLRGQGETGTNISAAPGGGPAVVAYFAEVPLVTGGGSDLFYDLASLQVLKGPQGTLFGRNTTGGAILFEPMRPSNDFGGYGQVTAGDYGDFELEGALNVPIVDDQLMARAAFQRVQRDGFTTDVGPYFPGRKYDNEDSLSGRFSLLWTPTAALENYLIVDSQHSQDHGPGISVFGVNPTSAAALADPQLLDFAAEQQARGPRRTSLDTHSYDLLKTYSVQDHLTYHFNDELQIKNIFSYSKQYERDGSDRDGMPAPLVDAIGPAPGRYHSDVGVYTDELQLQGHSFDDRLQWQGGGYYENVRGTGTNFNQIEFFGAANSYLATAFLTSTSEALYGQGTYAITPALKFTAGYRYTWDHLASGAGIGLSEGTPAVFSIGGAISHSGWSGTVGLDYQIDDDQLLYVTSRRGYKSGGFNYIPFVGYSPESDVDVELGYKASGHVADMPFRLDTDVFQTWYNNAQVATFELFNGSASGVTANAAAAQLHGFEFQGTLLPGGGFEISAGYSYNTGHYTKYYSATDGNLSGTPMQDMPKNKLDVGVRYNFPVDQSWGLVSASGNYSIQSKYFAAGQLGDPFAFIPGYGLLKLRLDWENIMSSSFDAGVFVTNATNQVYKTSVIPFYNTAFGYSAGTYGAPRMYGVQLRYTF